MKKLFKALKSSKLSEVGQGVHAHRTFGFATFDLVGTAAAAIALSLLMTRGKPVTHTIVWMVCLLLGLVTLGIGVHAALGIPTALNVTLGVA